MREICCVTTLIIFLCIIKRNYVDFKFHFLTASQDAQSYKLLFCPCTYLIFFSKKYFTLTLSKICLFFTHTFLGWKTFKLSAHLHDFTILMYSNSMILTPKVCQIVLAARKRYVFLRADCKCTEQKNSCA